VRLAQHAEPTKAQDPTTKVEPTPPTLREPPPVRRRRRLASPDAPTEIAGQMSFEDDPSET
jgi:hypothetical protein